MKMAYYTVFMVTPTTDAWIPDYLAGAGPVVAKHGGKFLTRTANHERLEGSGVSPGVIAILEWPSKEAAMGFYQDPAYGPHLQARLGGSTSDAFLVEGKDDFA
jgi:uncharacterized protein (DUF1330 family)